jgi:lysophospholipase L1-like esterase
MTMRLCLMLLGLAGLASLATAQGGDVWVTTWTASAHGPYPSGNAVAQPDLRFAFPDAAAGANDQTVRLIVRPGRWGERFRLRFANTFGTRPLVLDDVHLGIQAAAGTLLHGSNRAVSFGGRPAVTIDPGASVWSDAVDLPAVTDAGSPLLDGRKLAISFHVPGPTGPMTWHAKAMQTSYVTPPGSGAHGADESDAAFPFSTTSWFFLDAVEVMDPPDTFVVCALGDSITDGTASTINGDDRWPDVFARRMRAAYGDRAVVVNAGIGGNRVIGPATYPSPAFGGGPSALQRLDRDVLSISGLRGVVILEGVNDINAGEDTPAIIDGLKQIVARIHGKGPITVIGATITSGLGSSGRAGTPDGEAVRQAVNTFIRTGGVFDGVADFDAATRDPSTGRLRAELVPNSSVGGAGDFLHPNRAGYQAMGSAVDVAVFAPRPARRDRKER